MIEGLNPYPRYVNSGLPWIEAYPAHWQLRRVKVLFEERVQKGFPDEPLLAATQTQGVVRKTDYAARTVTAQKDLHLLKLVEVGDYVISLRSFEGGIEFAHNRGIISPAYTVLTPRSKSNTGYLSYFFKSKQFIDSLSLFVTGIREGQNVDYPRLSRAEVPVPSIEEQVAIVRFLDNASLKFNNFVHAKRRLIALLQEQKQGIILSLVLRGLNAGVSLKSSGLSWMGDIPRHWEVIKNRTLFAHRVQAGLKGLPVLQVSLNSGVSLEPLDQFGRPKRLIADATKYKLARKDDLAYNTMRMWQGAVGVVPFDGLVSPAYVVLQPRKGTCPQFFDYVFHTEIYKQQVNRYSTGIVSDRNRLYWDSFKQMSNLAPPEDEQKAIVRRLEKELQPLNAGLTQASREIALMKEYRARFISDVVTGKIDVRDAASKLPDLISGDSLDSGSGSLNEEEYSFDPDVEDMDE